MGDEHNPALHRRRIGGLERGEAVEADQFGLQPLRTGAAAVAECGEDQRLREGGDDLGRSVAPFPIGDLERLDPDVCEAQRLELRDGPVAGARFGIAAGLARADFGGEALGDLPGQIVGQRGVTQPGGLFWLRLGKERRGQGGGAERQQQDFLHGVGG